MLSKSHTTIDISQTTKPIEKQRNVNNITIPKAPHFATATRRMHPLLRCLEGLHNTSNSAPTTARTSSDDHNSTTAADFTSEGFVSEGLRQQLNKAGQRKSIQLQWNGGIPYINGIPMTQSLDASQVLESTPVTTFRVENEDLFRSKMLSQVESFNSLEVVASTPPKPLQAVHTTSFASKWGSELRAARHQSSQLDGLFPHMETDKRSNPSAEVEPLPTSPEDRQVRVHLPVTPTLSDHSVAETSLKSGKIGFEESVRSLIHETVRSHNPLPPPQKEDQSQSLFMSLDMTSTSYLREHRSGFDSSRFLDAPKDGAFATHEFVPPKSENKNRREVGKTKRRPNSSTLQRTIPFSQYANKVKVRRPKSAIPLFNSSPVLGGTGTRLYNTPQGKKESINKLVEKSMLEEQDKKVLIKLLKNLNVARKSSVKTLNSSMVPHHKNRSRTGTLQTISSSPTKL
mmetsp:Transcript_36801/g.48472  ORF Transcript_36801/g.48472 Transcript_36801/m.48472 type:complete len:457 (-) Transcript_36801:119-1489(-)